MRAVQRFRPIGLIAFIMAACLLLTSCGLFGQGNSRPANSGSVEVKPGADTFLGSSNGSPEVSIPAAAEAGHGTLSVTATDGPDGRKGWHLGLDGAKLTGTATIRFKNAVDPGQPAPLVGFNENPGDPVRYDVQSEVDGSDIVVKTTHFSNWFTDRWDWLMNWAKDQVKQVFTGTAGEDPKCDKESEARANGLTVTSDSGDNVKWCLGKAADGSTVLKLNNSRSYGVSVETTRGLTLARRGANIGDTFQKVVAKVSTVPSKKGNKVDILGPGETVEYKVDPADGDLGVEVNPSPPAYLATALWFGFQTITMVWGKIGKVDSSHIADVMDAVDCTSSFQTMSTAQVTSASAAADYLSTAIKAVMPCAGIVFKELAKGVFLDVVAVSIASVFSWLVGGIETAVNGIRASIDTAMALNGYRVLIRSQVDTTYTASAVDLKYSFKAPSSWRVSGPDENLTISDSSGAKIAGIQVLLSWGLEGPGLEAPVEAYSTYGGGTVNVQTPRTGCASCAYHVATEILDSRKATDKTGMTQATGASLGWPLPVVVSTHLSGAQAPPTTAGASFLGGIAVVHAGVPGPLGDTSRVIIFSSQKYFASVDEAKAWMASSEHAQVEKMIASIHVQ